MDCPATGLYYARCEWPPISIHRLTAILFTFVLQAAGADRSRGILFAFFETAVASTLEAAAVALEHTTQTPAGPLVSPRSTTGSQIEWNAPAPRDRKIRDASGNAVSCTPNDYGGGASEGGGKSAAEVKGAPVRRLGLPRAIISTLAQYLFNPDARRNVKRLGHKVVEMVKGVPTVDFELNYYQDKDSCLTAFDFAGELDALGLVPADTVKLKYLPAQHRGVLEYGEQRRSSAEFMKSSLLHKQMFLLPHGCVATTNSTWTAFCTTVEPPCSVGRIDLQTSKADLEEPPVPLQPVSEEEFKRKLLADRWDWYSIMDLYESVPDYHKPVTMMWNNDQCIMHAFFETKAIEKTEYLWMKSRQAFQIVMEQVDGTQYRKMSAFPALCGGRKAEDFVVTVKELNPEGNYKALMLTQVYKESATDDPEEIILTQEKSVLPLDDWDPSEDGIEFTELFPDEHVKPLLTLQSGPFE